MNQSQRLALSIALVGLFLLFVINEIRAEPDMRAAKRSTVVVEVYAGEQLRGHGSGVITEHGILTAAHVVPGSADRFVVRYWGGETREAHVVYRDYGHRYKEDWRGRQMRLVTSDIALLEVEPVERYRPVRLRCNRPRAGEPVFQVGHPLNLQWIVSRGAVTATHEQRWMPGGWLLHDAVAAQGNSGGGVFDRRGRLVGITIQQQISGAARSPMGSVVVPTGNTVAVGAETVCEFLGANRHRPGKPRNPLALSGL